MCRAYDVDQRARSARRYAWPGFNWVLSSSSFVMECKNKAKTVGKQVFSLKNHAMVPPMWPLRRNPCALVRWLQLAAALVGFGAAAGMRRKRSTILVP